jgi:hypothetical protein
MYVSVRNDRDGCARCRKVWCSRQGWGPGCAIGPNGVATGPGVDWQVLVELCIYIYFTGIVGGSVLLILLIPIPKKTLGATPVRGISLRPF